MKRIHDGHHARRFMPGIHAFTKCRKDVDGQVGPGHDEEKLETAA
jgi:hypothetical protein